MRITAVLLLAAMLAGSCSDDAGDAASTTTTSTTSTPATTSSTSTTTTTTSTTTTTTTTSTSTTTTTSTTTLPPPSTTDPALFESYTTSEMQVALADSHVYLGGSIIDDAFDWAVEQWGAAPVDDAIAWYDVGGEMEIWVSELIERTADGIPIWHRTDLVVTTYDPETGWVFSARCRLGGEPTNGVFAWYAPGDGPAQWIPAVEAWRVDFPTGLAAPINAGVVDCENEGFGI